MYTYFLCNHTSVHRSVIHSDCTSCSARQRQAAKTKQRANRTSALQTATFEPPSGAYTCARCPRSKYKSRPQVPQPARAPLGPCMRSSCRIDGTHWGGPASARLVTARSVQAQSAEPVEHAPWCRTTARRKFKLLSQAVVGSTGSILSICRPARAMAACKPWQRSHDQPRTRICRSC